ncbi:MAG: hypothetical protein Q9183_006331, partial [Haloplaca sp. 2 TL-2023]
KELGTPPAAIETAQKVEDVPINAEEDPVFAATKKSKKDKKKRRGASSVQPTRDESLEEPFASAIIQEPVLRDEDSLTDQPPVPNTETEEGDKPSSSKPLPHVFSESPGVAADLDDKILEQNREKDLDVSTKELDPLPQSIPLPLNDDLDLLEAVPDSPILQPLDVGGETKPYAEEAEQIAGVAPQRSSEEAHELLESQSTPSTIPFAPKALASSDETATNLPTVVSELQLPESVAAAADTGADPIQNMEDSPLNAQLGKKMKKDKKAKKSKGSQASTLEPENGVVDTSNQDTSRSEPQVEPVDGPRTQPDEEWPDFAPKKTKKGKKGRKAKANEVDDETYASKPESAESNDEASRPIVDVSTTGGLESTEGAKQMEVEPVENFDEWPTAVKRKKKGKKVKFDDAQGPSLGETGVAPTGEPLPATTDAAKDVEDLLQAPESQSSAVAVEESEGKDTSRDSTEAAALQEDIPVVHTQKAEVPSGPQSEEPSNSDAENLPSVPALATTSSTPQDDNMTPRLARVA